VPCAGAAGRSSSHPPRSHTWRSRYARPTRSARRASRTWARQLALEWGPERIRVNAIGPTATLTDLNRERLSQPAIRDALVAKIPLGRLLEPEDLIGAVAFLLGRESAMVTGQSLLVDGGFTIQ